MMTDLHTAIERLRQFSCSWNDDDCVDEISKLTGADLRLVVTHAQATGNMVPVDMLGTVSDIPLP